jgi:TrwC relaxase
LSSSPDFGMRRTASRIERAHQAAVNDALFIEDHALFTRTGPQGVRQVNVRGLVAAVFTHRDSRAGDPDLHTHVAVANKVQTLDGRWLSIDGRLLFKANVAASETYNTTLEQDLHEALGCGLPNGPAPTRGSGRSGRVVGWRSAIAPLVRRLVVGLTGFEPATSSSQTRVAWRTDRRTGSASVQSPPRAARPRPGR